MTAAVARDLAAIDSGQPSDAAPIGRYLTAAACFTLATAGFDHIAPLWVVHELGGSAGDWARLQSLRMGGTLAGVFVLGVIADSLGVRRSIAWFAFAAAVALVGMVSGPGWSRFVAMPCFGALISSLFVAMNTIAQTGSARRRARTHALWRGTGRIMAMTAPAAILLASATSYGFVLACAAGALVACAVAIAGDAEAQGGSRPIAQALRGYREILADPRCLRAILLSRGVRAIQLPVATFSALWFTSELGLPATTFAWIAFAAAVVGAAAAFAAAGIVERWDERLLLAMTWLVFALGATAMVYAALPLAIVGWIAITAASALQSAAEFHRFGGLGAKVQPLITTAKFVQALLTVATLAVLAVLVDRVGMRPLLIAAAALCAASAVGAMLHVRIGSSQPHGNSRRRSSRDADWF
ncbi:MAG: MFS transporter [Planctomycetes bacterium]|nr:MFS transporter [Planctomycetota bacterium]